MQLKAYLSLNTHLKYSDKLKPSEKSNGQEYVATAHLCMHSPSCYK